MRRWVVTSRTLNCIVSLTELWNQHRHFFAIPGVIITEEFHQIAFFITNRNHDVRRHADREHQVTQRHPRCSPERHYPADI